MPIVNNIKLIVDLQDCSMLILKHGGILSHHLRKLMKRNLLILCLLSFLAGGCAGGTWGTGIKPKTFGPKDEESIGNIPLGNLLKSPTSECSEKDRSEGKAGCN